jgi:hypothetical protein
MSAFDHGTCLSSLDLDRWELAGRPTEHPVHDHAATCESCRARLAERAPEAAVDPLVTEQRLDAILRSADARRGGASWWRSLLPRPEVFVGFGLAVVTVALLLSARPKTLGPVFGIGADDALGWRASDSVALQVRVGGAPRLPGAILAPGAMLAAELSVREAGYLAFVSIESNGHVSQILPAKGARAMAVQRGVLHSQGAVTRAAGIERLLVLYDTGDFDIRAAVAEIKEATGALSQAGPDPKVTAPRLAASWWFRHARRAQ